MSSESWLASCVLDSAGEWRRFVLTELQHARSRGHLDVQLVELVHVLAVPYVEL